MTQQRKQAKASAKLPDYPRTDTGKFAKGGPGKLKGMVSFEKQKLADACRALVSEFADQHFRDLFRSKKPTVQLLKVRQDAIEWATDRGWGKAPITVRTGIDKDSPEGILLMLAGQNLPGFDDEEPEE